MLDQVCDIPVFQWGCCIVIHGIIVEGHIVLCPDRRWAAAVITSADNKVGVRFSLVLGLGE